MSSTQRKPSTAAPLAFIPPLAPTLVESLPAGDNWLHEIKHEGFRTLLLKDQGRTRAFTRRGHDWSKRYPRIVAEAAALPVTAAIIDGETVVQDERGVSDISLFHAAIDAEPHRVLYFAFEGFFEWQKRADGKQPYRYQREDLEPFAFAAPHHMRRRRRHGVKYRLAVIDTPEKGALAECIIAGRLTNQSWGSPM